MMCRPECSVFALVLVNENDDTDIVMWIGTTVVSNATEGAKHAIGFIERARENGKFTTNVGYCPSLADLIYPDDPDQPKYRPLPDRAWFLALPGGSHGAIDSLKFWLRRKLRTPGHHRPKGVMYLFRGLEAEFLEVLKRDDRIPLRYIQHLT